MAKCPNCFTKVKKGKGGILGYCPECQARLIAAGFNKFYSGVDPAKGREAITEDNRIIDLASGEIIRVGDAVSMLMTDTEICRACPHWQGITRSCLPSSKQVPISTLPCFAGLNP